MSREITNTADGFRIVIENPIERQTLIVEELSRNIRITGHIHTTNNRYSVYINDGHLSDLIAALQEIRDRRKFR